MNTLFDIAPVLPHGFTYHQNFISVEEESQLVNLVEQFNLQQMKFHAYEAKRKVISFGTGWSFTDQQLKQGNPFPVGFEFLIEKIAKELGISTNSIVQFLITEYPVGSVINWHRDAPPFEIIAGISLLADCTFKLRPHEKEKQTKAATIASKTGWQHSTGALNRLRYSLTFRTLKQP